MRRFAATCALLGTTAFVSGAAALLTPACTDAPAPCDASQAFDGVPLTIPIPQGGRAFVTLADNADAADADAHIDVAVAGLAPGFSARAEANTVVIKAPYDLAGTIPARLVATCADGTDSAVQAVKLEVRA